MRKILCKNCKQPCCDNMAITLKKSQKGLNLAKLKKGDWLYVAGITWVKKSNGLWKCVAFDIKTGLCKIYRYRPPLCRSFQCKYAKKNSIKLPLNYITNSADTIYELTFVYKPVIKT